MWQTKDGLLERPIDKHSQDMPERLSNKDRKSM